MNFSQQTLFDCLLKDPDGNNSAIGELFNFTRTDGGFLKLIFFLTDKKKSVAEIESMQGMLSHIFSDLKRWDLGLNNSDLYYLNEYFRFESKLIQDNKRFQRISLMFKKQPHFEFVNIGVKRVHIFLTDIQKKIYPLGKTTVPGLKDRLEKIESLFKMEQIQELLKEDVHNLPGFKLLKSDNYLRFSFKHIYYEVLEVLHELEALFSLSKAVQKYNLSFPQISLTKEFKVKGAWNPLIKDCVKNSFRYEAGKNLTFLTGPNMSGKSTFLRTIGLIVCLSQVGMAVPAETAVVPFFDEVNVSITIRDNLLEGYSHFYSELKIVKSVALDLQKGKNCFTIFDELFKGTNLTDAIECSRVLINGFLQFKDSFFIISSHHIQLITQLDERHKIQFNYIEALIEDDKPKFTYCFRAGVSELHLGRYLFRKEGIDDLLSASQEN
jgi:DNA mismatch repair protein MutS